MARKTDLENEFELDLLIPKEYHVFLLNDDYTSMDFVIDILMSVFHKKYHEAEQITIAIHDKGKGLCGTFSYEIAETKTMQVSKLAREKSFPLKATMEEA